MVEGGRLQLPQQVVLLSVRIDLAGAGFQLAIVLGGIIVGGYVDRSLEYKKVTLACLGSTLFLLTVLGLAFGYDIDLPHWVVIFALLGLGASAGPVQPINAELAVEVSLLLAPSANFPRMIPLISPRK